MFILYYEILLTNFTVKLYKLSSTEDTVSHEQINSLTSELESKSSPKDIVEALDLLEGISQIEIYSSDSEQLLLRAGIDLDL